MTAARHLADLRAGLEWLEARITTVEAWGSALARVLGGGGRLLVAGNGGSAAQAQHLAGELVGRYRDERRPLSAIALTAETATLTALVNDYGVDEMFARQVRAHGRPGDVALLLSTSGRSPNVVAAARAAADAGLTTWAMTGPAPNPLAEACDEGLSVDSAATAAIQEVHLVAVHMLCEALDAALARGPS